MPIECNYVALVQHHNYSKHIDGLRGQYDRMDDVISAIDWTLGKNPKTGTPCEDDEKHYVYKTNDMGSTPSFWVLYRYEETEGQVYLLSIKPVETED